MGDLRDWSPESNGAVTEHRPVLSSPSPSSSNPNLTAISAGIWEIAEQTTQEIVSHVQPSVVSEERRKEVIDYVQNLIRDCLGCEVFPFGSVPLRTYLPDGDIDLTAFGGINFEDALASDVRSVLEGEDQNRAARFVVKDVQLIHAEVKLVKCLVQNIVVDISFNQLGGLCTLCFLEEVDRLIGKDHLFKRSIILTKAWCYYESRILGAHHGLISTYALETLVLYIFHLFHSSLNGPLAVLYKFLDYFSKFDWDNYCISLNGPVRISSLPEIMVETPENGGVGLLLSNEFLRKSVEMYSVSSKGSDMSSRTFPQKHLNIVDPLKENNNLGRSVSKGNFYRIRSAFTYGARKLGRILSQPEENLADELQRFFSNALDRHGSGQRPDVQDPVPKHGYNGFGPASSFSGIEACQEDGSISESESTDLRGCLTEQGGLDAKESLHDRLNSANRAALEMELIRTINERQRGSMRVVPSTMLSEADSYAHGTAVSGNRLSGDAKDLATPRIQDLGITDDAPKSSPASIEEGISPLGKAYHAPHLYFSRSHIGNGKLRNESPDQDQPENFDFTDNKASSRLLQAPDAETGSIVHSDRDENQLVCNHKVLTSVGSKDDTSMLSPLACALEDFHPGYRERASVYSAGSPETLNFLSDLSGDYKSHLRSLQYGRWCCEYALNPPMSPPLLSQFQSKNSWDAIRWSAQFGQNVFSHMNANGVVPRQAFYLMSPPLSPVAAFGMEEKPKPRGTGTYFPNTNHYRDRHSRGRHHASMRSPRNNGRAATLSETNLIERSSRELSQAQIPVHQSGGKHVSSDFSQFGSPGGKAYPNANGSMLPPERVMEFGPLATQPSGVTLPESSRQPNPSSSLAQNSNLSLPAAGMQRPKLVLDLNQDRVAGRSYRLKDEDDFPPLSG